MDGGARWLARLAAVCECVGVFLAAIVAQRLLIAGLGIARWKATQAEMLESGSVDFFLLSKLAAVDQLLKYGTLLGLAFAIGWWHRRRGLGRYGVTLARRSWGELLRIGIVLWAVSKAVPALLMALDDHLPWIGQGPEHWALFPSSWSAGFLLYMAVASFVLVPVVEELWARGYMVNRLREDFGDAGGLTLSAAFFTLAHTQYFKAELLSLGLLLALVIGSLAFGYALIRTGSLVPCIVAHALSNLPVPPGVWSEEIIFGLVAIVLVVSRRSVVTWGRALASLFGEHAWAGTLSGLAVLLGALVALITLQDHATIVAFVLLAVGIGGAALDRRATGRAAPSDGVLRGR